MAEILGLAVNIVTLIQLTGKITCLGYGYISGVKRAPKDLRDLVNELNTLSQILEILQDYADKNPDSTALLKLDTPLQECVVELKKLEIKLEPQDGLKGFLGNLKWPLKEVETLQYVARIERHKNLFILALTVDHVSVSKGIETCVNDTNLVVKEIQVESTARRGKEDALQVAEKRKAVIEWIYPESFDQKHLEISNKRQKETGTWLLESPEFKGWVTEQQNSRLLWGHGIPGAGKTFLSSLVIDHLRSRASGNHGLAYIYFEYQEQTQQSPVLILASLVKQLASRLPLLPVEVEKLYDNLGSEGTRPSVEDLYTALLKISGYYTHVFIVLDALDECNQDGQRVQLLPLFRRMCKDGINLFLTSRPHPEDIQDALCDAVKIELTAQEEDISVYIAERINNHPRARRLIQKAKCQDRIISQLVDCAGGMFLFVRFHIEYLCQQPTAKKLLSALEELKNSSTKKGYLDSTYDRIMETIRGQSEECAELALRVLLWLVKARRTLTVKEIQIAVSVEQGQLEIDELDLPDKSTLLDVCASLVAIDDNSGTIRLAHLTVQEYLLRNSVIAADDAEFTLAKTCLTYLSFDTFATGACTGYQSLKDRLDYHPFIVYAAKNLVAHLKPCKEDISKDAILAFLERPGNASSWIQANSYLGVVPLGGYFMDHEPRGQHIVLEVASSMGNSLVVQDILEREEFSFEAKTGGFALLLAAAHGHESIARLLIQHGTDVSIKGRYGRTALHFAAIHGHEAVVRFLLDSGAELSIADTWGDTVLHHAMRKGHQAIVRLLLEKGINVSIKGKNERTALHCAAVRGHQELVKLLLESGADPSVADRWGNTVLHDAAGLGHTAVVQLLLGKGIDVEIKNRDGYTPMGKATLWGQLAVVKLLLESGAGHFVGV